MMEQIVITRSSLLASFFPCALKAIKDCIWLFEQEQALGFSSVSTNIRMTVIKLKSGGLWVHAPIAPTKECIQVAQTISYHFNYYLFFLDTGCTDKFRKKFPFIQTCSKISFDYTGLTIFSHSSPPFKSLSSFTYELSQVVDKKISDIRAPSFLQ